MTTEPALLVSLDLAGTFIYAVNGGLTAVRAARPDIVGVVTLAMVSGLGGGIIRDRSNVMKNLIVRQRR